MEIQFDRAVAVVPLRVLAVDDYRYVSTDTIANVLRTSANTSTCRWRRTPSSSA